MIEILLAMKGLALLAAVGLLVVLLRTNQRKSKRKGAKKYLAKHKKLATAEPSDLRG